MKASNIPSAFQGPDHDHDACVADALERADRVCAERGLRLTPIRRRVLELIWASHKPTKAYDLLDTIRAEHAGAAPPTVYRALDFLLDAGLVHRLESLNAFVGCNAGHGGSHPKFLICRHCERVAEIAGQTLHDAIDREAAAAGFMVEGEVVELRGLCRNCANAAG